MKQEVSVDLSGGKRISFETGKLAKQAHGAVVVRIGDNVVLATATANPDPREGIQVASSSAKAVPVSARFLPAGRLIARFARFFKTASAAKLK
jgi:hypothetical protein